MVTCFRQLAFLFFVGLFYSPFCYGQKYWTSFNDLNDSLRNQPKPIMIFIHADWCKYCEMQDEISFTDTILGELVKDYYCLRLDVESQEEIQVLNKKYSPNNSGYHNLAISIASNKKSQNVVLPTTVFLDPVFQRQYIRKGLLFREELEQILDK